MTEEIVVCRHGHPRPKGQRRCVPCQRAANRRSYRKRHPNARPPFKIPDVCPEGHSLTNGNLWVSPTDPKVWFCKECRENYRRGLVDKNKAATFLFMGPRPVKPRVNMNYPESLARRWAEDYQREATASRANYVSRLAELWELTPRQATARIQRLRSMGLIAAPHPDPEDLEQWAADYNQDPVLHAISARLAEKWGVPVKEARARIRSCAHRNLLKPKPGRTCSEQGCENPYVAKGLCAMHYARRWRTA